MYQQRRSETQHCFASILIVFLQFQIPFKFTLCFRFCLIFFFLLSDSVGTVNPHTHLDLRALHTEFEKSQQRDKLITSARINGLDQDRSPRGFPWQPLLTIVTDRTGEKISRKIATETQLNQKDKRKS